MTQNMIRENDKIYIKARKQCHPCSQRSGHLYRDDTVPCQAEVPTEVSAGASARLLFLCLMRCHLFPQGEVRCHGLPPTPAAGTPASTSFSVPEEMTPANLAPSGPRLTGHHRPCPSVGPFSTSSAMFQSTRPDICRINRKGHGAER